MEAVLGGSIIFLGACLVLAASILISVRLYQTRAAFVVKILKYAVIGVFFLGFCVAALAIGLRIDERHTTTYSRGLKSVQKIWGGSVDQKSPRFTYSTREPQSYTNEKTGKIEKRTVMVTHDMGMDSQKININARSNIRQKGLLKYAGYDLEFDGNYTIKNLQSQTRNFSFTFPLPENAGNITNINVEMDQSPYQGDTNLADGFNWQGRLKPGETRSFRVRYNAKGTDRFNYLLGTIQREVRQLQINLTTDFEDYQIPDDAMAPTDVASDNEQKQLIWQSNNLITGQNIAIDFKISGNYGKVASKLFFYSPLSLGLFTGLLLIFTIARQTKLHPMHFLFFMTGFFIFYLFGSYVISLMHILIGISLSLVLSTGIMLYYAHLIKKGRELVYNVGFGAGMFQWMFSIAFFFPAYTGFLITLAAIIAFVVLMRSTASVDWEDKW